MPYPRPKSPVGGIKAAFPGFIPPATILRTKD
jgi:hypothetical protein